MLKFDIIPSNMSYDELSKWINECRLEISKANDNNNITYANKLQNIYEAMKIFKNEVANTRFSSYYKNNYLTESVTEEGRIVDLIEVDEMKNLFDKKLKNSNITLNAIAKFDGENKLVELEPITLDISFKLEFLPDEQHIILTYTPTVTPEKLDIDSISTRDYKATALEDGVLVKFKSISNLADELDGLEFTESIEWPFEMSFKSSAVEKKFNKNKTIGSKIVALLGDEQMINKVTGYQSTHSSGSNRRTRATRAEAEQRAIIQARGNRTRSQILFDMLKAIPGVTGIKEFDIPGNGKYFKRLRLYINGGFIDVMNGGLDFIVTDNASSFGNKREFITDTSDRNASLDDTRNKMITYVKKRIVSIRRNATRTPTRPSRTPLRPPIRPVAFDTKAEYDSFVQTANAIINGTSDIPISTLESKYDKLMDHESQLTDAQMDTLMQLAQELNI